MQTLAAEGQREGLAERIAAARARELTRHERRIEAIAGHPLSAADADGADDDQPEDNNPDEGDDE